MISNQLKELAAAKAKIAQLEAAVETELRPELALLPARYGFESAKAFAKAVKAASSGKSGRGPAAPGKRRKRAVITDATRAQVKKLVAEAKSGTEIAKAVGIPSRPYKTSKKHWAW